MQTDKKKGCTLEQRKNGCDFVWVLLCLTKVQQRSHSKLRKNLHTMQPFLWSEKQCEHLVIIFIPR